MTKKTTKKAAKSLELTAAEQKAVDSIATGLAKGIIKLLKTAFVVAGVLGVLYYCFGVKLAKADQVQPKVYVGVDASRAQLEGAVGENALNTVGVHAGVRVNENFSVEVGTNKSLEGKAAGTKTDLHSYTFDVIGHAPLTEGKQLELLGTVGLVHSLAETTTAGVTTKDDETGYALGVGLQYNLNEQLALRGLVRYEDVELANVGNDNAIRYTAGLNYNF